MEWEQVGAFDDRQAVIIQNNSQSFDEAVQVGDMSEYVPSQD
jgi:hypothetical protein